MLLHVSVILFTSSAKDSYGVFWGFKKTQNQNYKLAVLTDNDSKFLKGENNSAIHNS